ncbi:protein CHUP1, chloroplastic-like isoform X2 [Fagus crenata]
MLVRVSCLIVASVAAFSLSQINVGSSRKRNTEIKLSDAHESDLKQQRIEEMEEEKLENSIVLDEEEEESKLIKNKMQQNMKPTFTGKKESGDFKFLIPSNELSNVIERGLVQSLEKELEQRKVTLERKLLEYHGLKEQQAYIS